MSTEAPSPIGGGDSPFLPGRVEKERSGWGRNFSRAGRFTPLFCGHLQSGGTIYWACFQDQY